MEPITCKLVQSALNLQSLTSLSTWGQQKHAVNRTLTYHHLLGCYCELVSKLLLIFTHRSYGATLSFIWSQFQALMTVMMSVFGLYQYLKELSRSLAAKCSTKFTSELPL